MAKRKETQAERIAKIPIEEISKITVNDRKKLEKYVSQMRYGYKRRANQFKRQGVFSHAQKALEDSTTHKKSKPLSKMSRNQLVLEFARYQKFFNSQTATLEGINKINRDQDIRIFGADENGRPLHRMTEQERQLFWTLYDEYENQEPSGVNRYGYAFIWNQIGEMIISGDELSKDNLIQSLNALKSRLEKTEKFNLEGDVPNVYSGRGPTLK